MESSKLSAIPPVPPAQRSHGADCVVKVPVQRGGSVTIPCSYDQEYVHHVKYICKGVTQVWGFCSCFIRSDSRKTDQASVSDDAIQRVFTVTLTEMDLKDSGNYWCAVEIDWGRDYEGTHYQLSVSPGTPQLYVEQQNFMGLDGGSVTVQCYYSNSGPMKWCRMGSSCVEKYFGTLHGATVALQRILDNTDRKVMIVTMSELHPGNSGWHLCSIGDLQIPVHVTVMSRSSPQSKTLPSKWKNTVSLK
uniref:polymeric immunoglobulin receptor-like n=1 Tax=Centroberyx gerrardi TaxID=166262 RepID=UPI003AB0BDE0